MGAPLILVGVAREMSREGVRFRAALIIGGEEIGRRLRMASGGCCWSGLAGGVEGERGWKEDGGEGSGGC
jgi:hypothetical protein